MLFLVYALIILLPLPSFLFVCLLLCQGLSSTCPLLQKLFERCTFSTKISLLLPSFNTRRIALCDEPFVMTQDSPLPVAAFQKLGYSATSMIFKTERHVFAQALCLSLSPSATSFRRRPFWDWRSCCCRELEL